MGEERLPSTKRLLAFPRPYLASTHLVPSPPVTAYLALGSNLGNRAATLAGALDHLACDPHNTALRCSPVYETAPVGVTDQPIFLNAVVSLQTTHTPHGLLEACLAIERHFGRLRTTHWGPRTLDLDLLLYADLVLTDDRLTLPHPRLLERAFVLAPLADLAPTLVLSGAPIHVHLARQPLTGLVRL